MNKNGLLKSSLLATALASSSAFAHIDVSTDQCDVELNYDLSISPKHIRIIDNDQTIIDIYNDEVLFIKGDQVSLTSDQQQLVGRYAENIRQSIPEAAEIATEAVGVAYEGIRAAIGSKVDLSETEEKFELVKARINEKFNSETGHYRFSQGNLSTNSDNKEIEAMVEDVVEEVIPKLIGSLMMNIGSAMAGGETSFKDLENLGDKIEKEVEARAEVLEYKANAFCSRLKEVDKIEQELVAQNDNFGHFNLLKIN